MLGIHKISRIQHLSHSGANKDNTATNVIIKVPQEPK